MKVKQKDVVKAAIFIAILVGVSLLNVAIHGMMTATETDNLVGDLPFVGPVYIGVPDDEEEWHVEQVITAEEIKLMNLGEYTPTGGGWLSFFLLDYSEDPDSVLAVNGTDWSVATTAFGYADSDGWDLDLESERFAYFSCRARFNQSQCANGGVYDGTRARIRLTVTGDETITQVYAVKGDATNKGVESYNVSGADYMYINFYWDDSINGYGIEDDGELTIAEIRIEVKC